MRSGWIPTLIETHEEIHAMRVLTTAALLAARIQLRRKAPHSAPLNHVFEVWGLNKSAWDEPDVTHQLYFAVTFPADYVAADTSGGAKSS